MVNDYESASKGYVARFGNIYVEIANTSMEPTLSPGDVIVCKEVDPNTLAVGDIILYWSFTSGVGELNAHRIYAIYDVGDRYLFVTKGDNNMHPDRSAISEEYIVGKYERKAFLGLV